MGAVSLPPARRRVTNTEAQLIRLLVSFAFFRHDKTILVSGTRTSTRPEQKTFCPGKETQLRLFQKRSQRGSPVRGRSHTH